MFRVDYGSELLEINTTKKYNTGKWIIVEATRFFDKKRGTEKGAINIVNNEHVSGVPVKPVNETMLPNFSKGLFFLGGVPPGYKSGITKAPGADYAFLGCMKDIQEMSSPLESSHNFGVEDFCRDGIST